VALGTKTALITGPARGIGEGLARELARRGYQVSLIGLEFDRLKTIASEINTAARSGFSRESDSVREVAIAFEADVTDSAQLDRAVTATIEKFGRINVVVANAGIANNGSFASTHVEDLVRVVDVNLSGVIRTFKSAYEALVDSRGYALVISSASAFPALPRISAYGASKAGVEHFANNLRIEMAPFGVDIGVAYPSWIDTDLVRDMKTDIPDLKKTLDAEPNFLGRITPLDECVTILAEAIE
jgi:NAD(P)-dependent dehydrogenase (short-subunit alcohol dehydrogenase family)